MANKGALPHLEPCLLSKKTCKCPRCEQLHEVEDYWHEGITSLVRRFCEHCKFRIYRNEYKATQTWLRT
jgi:hypothetical protein